MWPVDGTGGGGKSLKMETRLGIVKTLYLFGPPSVKELASWWEYWIKTTARLWSIMRNRIKVIGKHFDIYPRFVKRLQDIQKVTLPLN